MRTSEGKRDSDTADETDARIGVAISALLSPSEVDDPEEKVISHCRKRALKARMNAVEQCTREHLAMTDLPGPTRGPREITSREISGSLVAAMTSKELSEKATHMSNRAGAVVRKSIRLMSRLIDVYDKERRENPDIPDKQRRVSTRDMLTMASLSMGFYRDMQTRIERTVMMSADPKAASAAGNTLRSGIITNKLLPPANKALPRIARTIEEGLSAVDSMSSDELKLAAEAISPNAKGIVEAAGAQMGKNDEFVDEIVDDDDSLGEDVSTTTLRPCEED
jgi:hypothetical protein